MKKIYLLLLITFLFLIGGMIFVYKSQKNQIITNATQIEVSTS